MASSPPFQVEDQTDADFFDKLVSDDDNVDFTVTATYSSMDSAGPVFADGNDSDEVKAFANLSINEVNNSEKEDNDFGIHDSGGQFGIQPNGEVKEVVDNEVKGSGGVDGVLSENNSVAIDGVPKENNGVLESSNSFEFQSVTETNSGNIGAEYMSKDVNKSSGSGALGVKEVQWSAFTPDSVQNDGSGFGSYSDFFTELAENACDSSGNVEDNFGIEKKTISGNELHKSAYLENSDYMKYEDGYNDSAVLQQSTGEQDLNCSQYWESLYPGWKFDLSTGQWYQVDGYDADALLQGSVDSNSASDWAVSDGKTEVSYLQQTVHSIAGTVPESGTTESVTNWNQVSQLGDATGNMSNWNQVSQMSDTSGSTSDWNQVTPVNNGYPSHMVFDPQYPGWYYDTNAQEWRSLDTYDSSSQLTVQAQEQRKQNGFASTDTLSHNDNQRTYDGYGQVGNYGSQGQDYNWAGSFDNYNEQASNMWQSETAAKMESPSDFSQKQQLESQYSQNFSGSNHVTQQMSNDYGFYEKVSQSVNDFSAIASSQSFVPSGNFGQQYNQPRMEQNEHKFTSNDYYSNQNSVNLSQQFHGGNQFSYAPTSGRSSAGRPPHALVTFGFGGKLIVTKENSSREALSFGSQSHVGSSISVFNLMEVVMGHADASGHGFGASDYFHALCRQSFTGPLASGSAGSKELNRWIDERISNSEFPDMDYRKADVMRLLLSLLKLSCQYYGKLRSPFGSDPLKENDVPEVAVAKLFASAKRQFNEYSAIAPCLQKLPSEGQMKATATEVQGLLVSGRKKDALRCAQEGQLWGPALVLAAQLGDQFYVDTVKQMALRQLVPGSPLRTLCLLIAGQPSDVFEMNASANISMSGVLNSVQQPAKLGANGMLDDWEANLAVITANRTKDDELVLIHLGDCIWKEKHDVVAAHICYLVAEANFEPYADTARMCLIGADHWKFPRTYASPEAIQRTEIYEYSKVLGNSQYVLLPFQPYKLVYAHMLAEVGRISDALKYCQSVLKSLKTGRAPEVETLRQLVSSLEERIKTHQQGGFSTNLAPAKLVGKLLNLFDSTAHRVVGGLPPPVPSTSGSSVSGNEHHQMGSRVSTSQSTMAMSSLIPSASMEPISQWASDTTRMTMHSRSVSEPDFGRSPRQGQVDSSKEISSTNPQGETSNGGTSRFGRFGFGSQLLQKTVGLVLRPRQGRQAKLGEKNKFYYDEKLKRWVEEGAEPPAEETALPPPPTTAAFQNGTSDYNLKTALKIEGTVSNGSLDFKSPTVDGSGIPPLPPTSNQFSARARMGVRSRYVDTFNQGGGNQTNLFQSPSIPSIKPAASANPKFFVPTPVSSVEERIDNTSDSLQASSANNGSPSNSNRNDSFQSPVPSSLSTMQRFGSMDHIPSKVTTVDGSFAAHSRRTASWSGSFDGNFSPPTRTEVKPLGEVLGMPPSTFMPNDSSMHSSVSGGSFGDDLHEVEL